VDDASKLKPMSFWRALLFFGIPAVVAILIVYVAMPYLDLRGVPTFWNYLIVYATSPMLALIIASIIAFRQEGNALSWTGLKTRFRLNKMGVREWLWTVGLALFMFLSAGLFSFTARWLVSHTPFVPPASWPADLNPAKSSPTAMTAVPTVLMGIPLAGNWWVFFALLASLIVATFGEEFWWRGYILPRQEMIHGRWTWVVHGLLWALFHLYAPWNLITILPGCLALSFVAQRLKNTWPALIAHGLANGLGVLTVTLIGIAG